MNVMQGIAEDLLLPEKSELLAELNALTETCEVAKRCLETAVSGVFDHPDGHRVELNGIRLSPSQLALIAHLSRRCPGPLSIDVGFGMGSSATMICAARNSLGAPFEHLAFDPFGLGDGRDAIVQSYLETRFPGSFKRVWKRSEIGLAQLFDERGARVGMSFIDGNHTFEAVMADFVLSDLLCCPGGYIVFDDAYYPAIEAAIQYIAKNRSNYAVAMWPVPNTAVLQKIAGAAPQWDSFEPFPIPQRRGWTPAYPGWAFD